MDLLGFLVWLLDDHDRRIADYRKRRQEEERQVDCRAGKLLSLELLSQWDSFCAMEWVLADRLRRGEITRGHIGFSFPINCLRFVKGKFELDLKIQETRPPSPIQEDQPPPPRIRSWLHEAIGRAEDELKVDRDKGLPWWLAEGCGEDMPLKFALREVLGRLKCDCDVEQLRQHVEAVRDGQATQTSDLSIELARLSEQAGLVEKLIGQTRNRFPELPVETEPLKPTEKPGEHQQEPAAEEESEEGTGAEELPAESSTDDSADRGWDTMATKSGKRRIRQPRLVEQANREQIVIYEREHGGSDQEVLKGVKKHGVKTSLRTVQRVLQKRRRLGKPAKAAPGRHEREPVADEGSADPGELDAYTMPDDD